MAKKYFYTLPFLVFLFTLSLSAQEVKQQTKVQENTSIEGLNLYPNPVSNGKVYITSKNDSDKEIIIFDVLGKKVLQTRIIISICRYVCTTYYWPNTNIQNKQNPKCK